MELCRTLEEANNSSSSTRLLLEVCVRFTEGLVPPRCGFRSGDGAPAVHYQPTILRAIRQH